MLGYDYCNRISDDWMWREKDLREMDRASLKFPGAYTFKSGLLIVYSHWEGHFKFSAQQVLSFMDEGIKRKIFRWTDVRPEIRQRLLFCSYRKSSIQSQTQETFISYLNALSDERFSRSLTAKDEIIMVDDNLSGMRAEAICRNLGLDHSWVTLKRTIIDQRLLEYRNAIAHGDNRLRTGDPIELSRADFDSTTGEIRDLIRQTKDQFSNAITLKSFLSDSSPQG